MPDLNMPNFPMPNFPMPNFNALNPTGKATEGKATEGKATETVAAAIDQVEGPADQIDPPRPAAAIAILYQNNQFLLQLRDDFPDILYPGHWAFFGGHLEPGESPVGAMQRELEEEIGYRPPQIHHFQSYLTDAQIIRHVFYAPLVVGVEKLQLHEGQDLGLSTIEEVDQGYRFSARIGQNRPLANPHRQILLDFLQRHKDEISFTSNGDGNGKNL